MNEQQRRLLQQLMTDERWSAVEAFFDNYMLRNFAQQSIKRQSEFETMWQASENEGGRKHIMQALQEMEHEASQAITND